MGTSSKKIGKHPVTVRGPQTEDFNQAVGTIAQVAAGVPVNRAGRRAAESIFRRKRRFHV